MISKKLETAINDQINFEMYSSYIYMSMATHFDSINLKGFSHWMKVQAQEELTHAMRFWRYLIDRGGKVVLSQIQGPTTSWQSPLAVFEDALHHEHIVTGKINKLVDIARSESDYASDNLLQWFIKEQVEEEASADEVIQKLKLIGDNSSALFLLDQELAARTYLPPADIKFTSVLF